MPFKAWAAGEEVLATDFNTYVGNQVVATFLDAAQRSSQLPAPDIGQLSTLDSRQGALFIYRASGWAEVGPYVQSGNRVFTTDAGGVGTVQFPAAFATPPACVMVSDMSSNLSEVFAIAVAYSTVTTTEFSFAIRKVSDGTKWASQLARVAWVAIGIRA